jgi:hypothetical protein
MFVTDTLGNPYAEVEELGSLYRTISESRLRANEIKRKEPITVVIGNPPINAMVQLSQEKPRAADHWRPPAAVQARRHPARPLAGRVHVGTAQRPERADAIGGDGARPRKTIGGDLWTTNT